MTTRRTLIAAAGAATAVATIGPAEAAHAATGPVPGLEADPIAHLLRRATFGPTPAALAEARRLGLDGWLNRQLDPAAIDDSRAAAVLTRLPLAGASIPAVRSALKANSYAAFGQLGRAAIVRAAWSDRQLYEVVVQFWANHLHVAAPSGGTWDSRPDYDAQVLRRYALGTYADLLKASMRHPAMLTYLDNRTSTKTRPNENYARELMELHTVGLIYSEEDVRQAARLLTGMTVDKDGGYVYDPSRHAGGPVKALGFGHANPADESGPLAFCDYLARHPATAQRLARKLCVRFVADVPPESLVARLAQIYLDNDTAIVPVLRALFTSAEFAGAFGGKTRTPFEDMIATVRTLGLGPETAGVKALDALYNAMVDAGNAPLRWDTPDGFPDLGAAWASASGFLLRCNLHLNLATGWYPSQLTRPADLLRSLVPSLPTTYGGLVDALATRLTGTKLPAEHTAAVLSVAGKLPTSPLRDNDKSLAGSAPYLIALVLDSPTFQLR
ncbi:DUF1800 domain-containing protein [Actinoplanes subtropicus]|uniref:DUF1800 domain-containing protein n=1 Tax=Actinoplanes subtropicus TaxID=543632 RepID=UPI0004C41CDD|nr:DUF1800 domain-containing protein [Actinoplanes subtropicus]